MREPGCDGNLNVMFLKKNSDNIIRNHDGRVSTYKIVTFDPSPTALRHLEHLENVLYT